MSPYTLHVIARDWGVKVNVNWTAVGSVFTAIAALAAIGAILPALYVYRRQDRLSRSSEIRREMRSVLNGCKDIRDLTGMSISAIVDVQVRTFRKRLGPSATANSFRENFFAKDNFIIWSSYQEACWESPAFSRLSDLWSSVDRASSELRGLLQIFYYVTRFVVGDSLAMCFPTSSLLILEQMRNDSKLKDQYASIESLDELTLIVSTQLGSRMMDVYRMGYDDRIECGVAVLTGLYQAMANLTDKSLLQLSLKGVPLASEGDNIDIDDIERLLPEFDNYLSRSLLEGVRNQLPHWKEVYTEEYAKGKLGKLESTNHHEAP